MIGNQALRRFVPERLVARAHLRDARLGMRIEPLARAR